MKDPSPKGRTVGDDDDRFLNDPLLPSVFRQEQDDYFALGLVMNWPTGTSSNVPPDQHGYNSTNYEKFLSTVKAECFPEQSTSKDFLFFKPFHALHITIASLVSAHSHKSRGCAITPLSRSGSLSDHSMASVEIWKRILQKAAQSPDWPRRPLELQVDSAQIRNRAGILLWMEHTGGIVKMRRCIRAAVETEKSTGGVGLLPEFRTPNIIHTTFVRYHNCDENQSWRPSQANAILLESVIPNQPLFTSGSGSSTQSMEASFASLVDCKIYLLGPDQEKDHEIFLSLPLECN